jgi:alpha-beta hydrolase superfamily lysophospholipase
MTRAVALLVAGMAAGAARGQEPPAEAFQLLARPVEPGARITPYLRWQLDRAWEQDARRQETFAAVRTEADLVALRATIRARLLERLGGLPSERTPLNARVVDTIAMRGYRIEKLVFESQPGLHVTALVYVPDGPAGRRPAVLVACGHAPDGKSFKNYQELAGQLVLRGYVVICWDPVGQGERSQFWNAAANKSRYNLVCGEHAVLGNLACVAGTSLNRYEVWDGMRALDYLLTRDDVDPARVAVTGTSGGGQQAAYLGALDERIAVVAPSCFITSMPMRMANRIFEDPDSDPEQDPPGLVSDGIDHAGLLLLVYPRPLIVAAAVKDFVPIEGARRAVRELSALYERFGHPGRVAIAEGYHTHQFSPENRRAVFAFLDRFNRLPAHDALDAVEILDPQRLRCTPSGQVRVDLKGRSLPEVIRDDWRARRPAKPSRFTDLAIGTEIAAWPVGPYASGPAPERTIAWEAAGGTTVGAARVDRYWLRHGGLAIPVVHVHRGAAAGAGTIVDVALHGKVGPAEWAETTKRLDQGHDVVSFDLRGVGETRMRYRAESVDDPALAAAGEEAAYEDALSGVFANYVYNDQVSGRPYLVGAIEDVAIVTRFARERLGARRVHLRGRGDARLLAASAADGLGLEELQSDGEPAFRWSEAVERMQEVWPIQYLLPLGADYR